MYLSTFIYIYVHRKAYTSIYMHVCIDTYKYQSLSVCTKINFFGKLTSKLNFPVICV